MGFAKNVIYSSLLVLIAVGYAQIYFGIRAKLFAPVLTEFLSSIISGSANFLLATAALIILLLKCGSGKHNEKRPLNRRGFAKLPNQWTLLCWLYGCLAALQLLCWIMSEVLEWRIDVDLRMSQNYQSFTRNIYIVTTSCSAVNMVVCIGVLEYVYFVKIRFRHEMRFLADLRQMQTRCLSTENGARRRPARCFTLTRQNTSRFGDQTTNNPILDQSSWFYLSFQSSTPIHNNSDNAVSKTKKFFTLASRDSSDVRSLNFMTSSAKKTVTPKCSTFTKSLPMISRITSSMKRRQLKLTDFNENFLLHEVSGGGANENEVTMRGNFQIQSPTSPRNSITKF